MKNSPENELLSAYLDNELASAERAEVEAWLARDPAARRLLDELRLVGASLQSLPRQNLGEDLSSAVLRAAERQILVGSDRPLRRDPRVGKIPLWRSIARRLLQPRTLIWPVVAAAAAIVIAVMQPPSRPEAGRGRVGPVASAPTTEGEKAEREKAVVREDGQGPRASSSSTDAKKTPDKMSPVAKPAAPAPAVETPKAQASPPKAEATPTPPAGFTSPALAAADSPDKLMIIRCDVAQDAAKQGAFEKVLVGQRLHPVRKSNDPQSVLAKLDKLQGGAIPVSRAPSRPVLPGAKPVYVQVEGTPRQIEAALEEFKVHPDKFPSCWLRFVPLSPIPGQGAGEVSKTEPKEPAADGKSPASDGTRSVLFVVHVVPGGSNSADSRPGAEKPVASPAGPSQDR